MKVKELIIELQKQDPEMEIILGAEGAFQGEPVDIEIQENKVVIWGGP